jgi:hypothetical protein
MTDTPSCTNYKFYFKVNFYPECTQGQFMDFLCGFWKEVNKTSLNFGLVNFLDDDTATIEIGCCQKSNGMPCAECLWALYVFTANSTFPQVKEITLVDESGKTYARPILFYPCVPMASS